MFFEEKKTLSGRQVTNDIKPIDEVFIIWGIRTGVLGVLFAVV